MARVRDIVLKITGEADEAVATFQRVLNESRKLDGTTATATIEVDKVDLDQAIARAKKELEDFGRMSEAAALDVDIAKVQAKIEQVKRNLENLGKQAPSAKVDVQTTQALAQLNRLQERLDRLGRRRTEIDVGVDTAGAVAGGIGATVGAVAGTAAAATQSLARGAATAASAFTAFFSGITRGVPILGGLARGFLAVGVSASAAGLAVLSLLPIIAAALINAVMLVTGALIALAASFLTAAAGAGVFALALAAMAGPVVLVAIAAMQRLKLIMDAVKESEEQSADQAARVRDANQQMQAATENLAQAQRRLKDATVEAYRAWRDAIEDVSDAMRGIERAELNEDQARLNLDKANEELANFRKQSGLTQESLDNLFKKFTDIDYQPENLIKAIRNSPAAKALRASGAGGEDDLAQLILNQRGAQLDLADATDAVGDAETRAADATARRNEFIREGIEAYDPYVVALQGVHDAQDQVRNATESYTDALRKQGEAMAKLTPQERRLANVIKELKTALFDAFRPATSAVFDGVLDFLGDVRDFAQDSRVRSGLTNIGRAIGDVFRTMGRELRRRETREAFGEFADAAAKFIRRLDSDVLRQFFRLLIRVAREALPWVLESVVSVGSAIGDWAGDITRSDIEGFVTRVRRSFNRWKDLIEAVGKVIVRVFGDANDKGDDIVETLTKIIRRFDRWLEKNPDAIKRFFEDAKTFANDFLYAIEDLTEAIKEFLEWADKLQDAWGWIADKIGDLANRGLLQMPGQNSGFGRQHGGFVPGAGTGDIVPAMLEPGEFVIRRSVAQALGAGRLHALNAGNFSAALVGGGGGVHIENINLPPAPGHAQMGDPRHQAALLAAELRRRGGGRIG